MIARWRGWPPEIAITWDATHRLVLATYADTSEPFLADLAEGSEELADLVELAAATNARLAAQSDRLVTGIGSDELLFETAHSKIVNAAFAYPGPFGARFSGPDRGAWYAARAATTAVREVAHHRSVHLAETDWWHETVDYQDYLSDIHAEGFADLRVANDERAADCLRPDSYRPGQALAERLLAKGAAGVVYPAVRHRGGTNVAVFRPAIVANVRAGARYRLTWKGTPRPVVRKLP